MEKWTDVPFASFFITHVSPMIKNKIDGAKNKGRKPLPPQRASMYFFFNIYIYIYKRCAKVISLSDKRLFF